MYYKMTIFYPFCYVTGMLTSFMDTKLIPLENDVLICEILVIIDQLPLQMFCLAKYFIYSKRNFEN